MELRVQEHGDYIVIVTIDNQPRRNAMPRSMMADMAALWDRLEQSPCRCIVLTGAGDRAFTAGLDLKELGSEQGALGAANDTDPANNPVKAIEVCRKPVVGAINGVAITGGFEVALACDVLIARTNARFADTHARVGIVPGWGLSQKLSRMIGISRAKELAFTGNFLDAETAKDWGLVNRIVAADDLEPAVVELAQQIAAYSPDVVGLGKAAFYKQLEMTEAAAYEMAMDVIAGNAMIADGQEGMISFDSGAVINATVENLRGEDAIYRQLLWRDGQFDLEFRKVSLSERTVHRTTQALLMEGMRRLDEWSRLSELLLLRPAERESAGPSCTGQ